jgi:hypothetical protein
MLVTCHTGTGALNKSPHPPKALTLPPAKLPTSFLPSTDPITFLPLWACLVPLLSAMSLAYAAASFRNVLLPLSGKPRVPILGTQPLISWASGAMMVVEANKSWFPQYSSAQQS